MRSAACSGRSGRRRRTRIRPKSERPRNPFGTCAVCGIPLLQKGGYRSITGMCEPCTTGEASTVDEVLT